MSDANAFHVPPVALVAGKSDKDRAAEYRDKLLALINPICEVMTEANRDGLRISFSLGCDAFGRSFVAQLDIAKPL